jgi:hypothetical protein
MVVGAWNANSVRPATTSPATDGGAIELGSVPAVTAEGAARLPVPKNVSTLVKNADVGPCSAAAKIVSGSTSVVRGSA